MKENKIGGQYSTPIILPEQKVLKEWLDYNGHMNVAYYTLAFDKALDFFFEDVLANQFRNRYTTIKIISIKIK